MSQLFYASLPFPPISPARLPFLRGNWLFPRAVRSEPSTECLKEERRFSGREAEVFPQEKVWPPEGKGVGEEGEGEGGQMVIDGSHYTVEAP